MDAELRQLVWQRTAQRSPARMRWARLLKRVFALEVEPYPPCGGALKIIAASEDPPVMVRILPHLGLPTSAPARRVELFQAA
jgi:hypothetical protein